MRWLPALALLAFACSSNPHQVWIAENGTEAMIKLVDKQPDPF